MFRIVEKRVLAERIKEIVVDAPLIARTAKPGHFVLVRGDEHGERIPLTIADSDAKRGTVTLVMQEVGRGTIKLGGYEVGQSYADVVGPLGQHREIPKGKTIVCVSGGLGLAPMYPQTKAYHAAGNKVISIVGARNKSLLFWQDRIEKVSTKVLYSTDDGSFGHHGFATQLLEDLVAKGEKIDEVVAIGPVPHMRAVAETCKKHGLPVTVSLNPIMVDGTGMCGGCRVTVGGQVKYACVDGPEFDGAEVDFAELMSRQGTYRSIESNGDGHAGGNGHECLFNQWVAEMVLALEERPRKHDETYFERQALGAILKGVGEVVEHRRTFNEVAHGYSEAAAMVAAMRCKLCELPSCVQGCPVEIDIPGFIRHVQRGDFAEAARVLKQQNSLPAVCGRVCPQETQCESKCLLKKFEDPVTIGQLERFVADWEAAHMDITPVSIPQNGKKVGVIGSGPGGLTCAGDLAKLGYDVTVFEAFHEAGGVLRYGIPEFRLPKTIVDRELEYLKSLGVKIECNMVIGKVFTIEELMSTGYDAVFIGVGAGAPVFMNIPGENFIGVYSANEFLTRVNLMKAYRYGEYETPVLVGEKVAVIGAGNVAMDAARVAVRLGAKEVSIVYRRSEAEIPARADEVKHAMEEGVVFKLLTQPVAVVGDDKNRVRGLACVKCELGAPDKSGRRRPIPVHGSDFVLDCDMVIPALGSNANPLLTGNTKGLELNKWGNIVVDPKTGGTSLPGVYAGGDIVTGAATVIEAMGAGKIAARSIHEYLSAKEPAAAKA